MNRILLVTRPRHDDTTEYLSYYASLVLKKAEALNIDVKDFEGKEVNCGAIYKFIIKKDPKLIFLNGHGDDVSIEYNKGEILFSTDKNMEMLKDRIIYARACYAGVSFGKEVVKNNDGCFIGYISPFSFWIDERYSANPSKDKIAALFLEPSNEIVDSLLKGNKTETVHERSRKMMIESMKTVLRMEERKEPIAMNLLQVLWNNYEGQILHGNSGLFF
jgi:hypothetical protein